MKTPTIEQLRKQGYKVRVLQSRYRVNSDNRSVQLMPASEIKQAGDELYPYGGETIVQIKTPQNVELEGRATCSLNDIYNRKLGNNIAIGRALSKI